MELVIILVVLGCCLGVNLWRLAGIQRHLATLDCRVKQIAGKVHELEQIAVMVRDLDYRLQQLVIIVQPPPVILQFRNQQELEWWQQEGGKPPWEQENS